MWAAPPCSALRAAASKPPSGCWASGCFPGARSPCSRCWRRDRAGVRAAGGGAAPAVRDPLPGFLRGVRGRLRHPAAAPGGSGAPAGPPGGGVLAGRVAGWSGRPGRSTGSWAWSWRPGRCWWRGTSGTRPRSCCRSHLPAKITWPPVFSLRALFAATGGLAALALLARLPCHRSAARPGRWRQPGQPGPPRCAGSGPAAGSRSCSAAGIAHAVVPPLSRHLSNKRLHDTFGAWGGADR